MRVDVQGAVQLPRPSVSGLAVCIVASIGLFIGDPAFGQWSQWGGQNRDFRAKTQGLADEWPKDGPKRLWHKELGVGYSGIVVDDGLLYTMYRKTMTTPEEYTVALDAKTGEQIWQHANSAAIIEKPDERWGGQGPNSTPLIVGDRLFAVGSRSVLHCFNKKTGEVLWSHDLAGEFNAPLDRHCGYCCSPIAYKDMIILAIDKERPEEDSHEFRVPRVETLGKMEGQTLAAFKQATGELVWKELDFKIGYSSPILIQFGGGDQLVFSTRGGLIGVDPNNGFLLWHHPVVGREMTPIWHKKRSLLFYTSHDGSTLGLAVKLTEKDGQTVAKELWLKRKIRIGIPTPVRVGDFIFGATDQLLMCVNMKTGKRQWARRGYPEASCVYGDGKLIVLDQNGRLTLATVTPEMFNVCSQCTITEKYSLTAPALVGRTLYVRDRKHIMALDVGEVLSDD